MKSDLLDSRQVSSLTGLTQNQLRRQVADRSFPAADTVIGCLPKWRKETVETWLAKETG